MSIKLSAISQTNFNALPLAIIVHLFKTIEGDANFDYQETTQITIYHINEAILSHNFALKVKMRKN